MSSLKIGCFASTAERKFFSTAIFFSFKVSNKLRVWFLAKNGRKCLLGPGKYTEIIWFGNSRGK
jgi:hypothetical protein